MGKDNSVKSLLSKEGKQSPVLFQGSKAHTFAEILVQILTLPPIRCITSDKLLQLFKLVS